MFYLWIFPQRHNLVSYLLQRICVGWRLVGNETKGELFRQKTRRRIGGCIAVDTFVYIAGRYHYTAHERFYVATSEGLRNWLYYNTHTAFDMYGSNDHRAFPSPNEIYAIKNDREIGRFLL